MPACGGESWQSTGRAAHLWSQKTVTAAICWSFSACRLILQEQQGGCREFSVSHLVLCERSGVSPPRSLCCPQAAPGMDSSWTPTQEASVLESCRAQHDSTLAAGRSWEVDEEVVTHAHWRAAPDEGFLLPAA